MNHWPLPLASAAWASCYSKSVRPERIAQSIDIFDFELSTAEVAAIDALDKGVRGGPDPDTFDTTQSKAKVED